MFTDLILNIWFIAIILHAAIFITVHVWCNMWCHVWLQRALIVPPTLAIKRCIKMIMQQKQLWQTDMRIDPSPSLPSGLCQQIRLSVTPGGKKKGPLRSSGMRTVWLKPVINLTQTHAPPLLSTYFLNDFLPAVLKTPPPPIQTHSLTFHKVMPNTGQSFLEHELYTNWKAACFIWLYKWGYVYKCQFTSQMYYIIYSKCTFPAYDHDVIQLKKFDQISVA